MAMMPLRGLLLLCCQCSRSWAPVAAPEPPQQQQRSLLAPSYLGPGAGFADVLALLTMAGLANRETPSLWLNASAPGWSNGAPVNWPLPGADAHWLRWLEQTKGIRFDLGSRIWGQNMVSEGSRLAESERGVGFG